MLAFEMYYKSFADILIKCAAILLIFLENTAVIQNSKCFNISL